MQVLENDPLVPFTCEKNYSSLQAGLLNLIQMYEGARLRAGCYSGHGIDLRMEQLEQ